MRDVQFKGFALELNGAAAFYRQRSPCTELRFAVHRCDTLRRRQAAAPLAIMMNIFLLNGLLLGSNWVKNLLFIILAVQKVGSWLKTIILG